MALTRKKKTAGRKRLFTSYVAVNVRCTDEQTAWLEQHAAARLLNRSAILRELIDQAMARESEHV